MSQVNTKTFASIQEHHDYYVRLYDERLGNLTEAEFEEFEVAIMRERKGDVFPLDDTAERT
jgi:hypothetical protein